MNFLTPAPSFRPVRSMNRTRALSSSSRRVVGRSRSETIYITTDRDKEHVSHENVTSCPDEDLIFQMSPVRSCHPTPSSSTPVLSLYPFPLPANTSRHEKQARTHGSSQNRDSRRPPAPGSCSASSAGEHDFAVNLERPFATSLLNTPAPPCRAKDEIPISPHPRQNHTSSPIPIPRKTSRSERDPTVSSILFPQGGDSYAPPNFSGYATPSHVRRSRPIPFRIEGFGEDEVHEFSSNSCSPTSSTVCSSAGSGPFRLAKFIHEMSR